MVCKILIGGETGVKEIDSQENSNTAKSRQGCRRYEWRTAAEPGNKPAGLKAAATMTNQMSHQNKKNISAKR
jgi:hypothetical protein